MTRTTARSRRRGAGDEQQGLPLAAGDSDAGPGWIDAEASTPCSTAFDADDWLFSIDWEGSRCLLATDVNGVARLQGLVGMLTARFPELVGVANTTLPPGTVLDGVVCLLDADGRPDLPALGLRIAGAGPPGAVFLASDLLHVEGASLAGHPLHERVARLTALLPANPHLQVPEPVRGHGLALADAAAERGLGALLARRRHSRYRGGVASPDRLHIDLSGRQDRVVAGRRGAGAALELILGEVAGGHLVGTGSVPLVGAAAVRRWFDRVAEPVATPPVADGSRWGPGITWLQPRLTATIDTITGGPFRSTALVALRDDIDPRWCVRRAPVSPPGSTGADQVRAFTPTVLNALPLDAA